MPADFFRTAVTITRILIEDNVMSNYQIGLKLLEHITRPPIASSKVKQRVMQKELKQFTDILLKKSLEHDKDRKLAQKSLIQLYQNPALDTQNLLFSLLDAIDKKAVNPETAAERLLIGRLELYIKMV